MHTQQAEGSEMTGRTDDALLAQKCLPDGVPFDKDGNPRKRYVRITYDGLTCVSEPQDVDDMTEGDPDYKLEDVMLSEQEYEALPEFEGW
jgi:hypothetical protein